MCRARPAASLCTPAFSLPSPPCVQDSEPAQGRARCWKCIPWPPGGAVGPPSEGQLLVMYSKTWGPEPRLFLFCCHSRAGKKKIEERSTDQRCITCAPCVSPLYILRVSTHIKCSAVFSCEVTGSVKLLISNVRRGPDWLTGNNYDSFNLGGRLPGQCLQPGLESGSWWLQALWLTLRPAPTQRWASASSKSQMLGTLGPELGSGGLVSSPKTGCCQH